MNPSTLAISGYESEEELGKAAASLKLMGPSARKMLEECVEYQGVVRRKASPTALKLEEAGFLIIRDTGSPLYHECKISPTLAGEAVLEYLDENLGQ